MTTSTSQENRHCHHDLYKVIIMEENLFETSLSKNETALFFAGKGEYYCRNREDYSHAYVTHMTGWVANYIGNDLSKLNIVIKELSEFLNDNVCKPTLLFSINMNLLGLSRLLKDRPHAVESIDKKLFEKFLSVTFNYYTSLPPDPTNRKIQEKIIASINENGFNELSKTMSKALMRYSCQSASPPENGP